MLVEMEKQGKNSIIKCFVDHMVRVWEEEQKKILEQ